MLSTSELAKMWYCVCVCVCVHARARMCVLVLACAQVLVWAHRYMYFRYFLFILWRVFVSMQANLWISVYFCMFDYILITNFCALIIIYYKILISSTCFEPQVLIFRRIELYTCSILYCHSLWEFLVACRYTAWVKSSLNCTTVSSWRWALEARNM